MKARLSELDPERLSGRVILVRSDLNVPLDEGRVVDDQRIRASLPTYRLLAGAGARVVVLSHLGRPEGRVVPELSLAPVAERLGELLDRPVVFVGESVGPEVEKAVARLDDGEVAVLENTRFLSGDTEDDPELARAWGGLGSLFVNDAFGTAHRAHASTSGVAEVVRARGGEAVAGLLLERELSYLHDALRDPERPFVGILGGAKISGKIDVVSALLPKVDRLLVGGAMANTFFRAMGLETGRSLVEDDRLEMARTLMDRSGEKLLLPRDAVVAETLTPGATTRVVALDEVGPDDRIGDIGPLTIERFREVVGGARTVVWNGPMGVFEVDPFATGTVSVAHAVAAACDRGALGVVGGGDSGAAAERAGVAGRISHISTGGGASLELLAGRTLPGVAALSDAA